MKKFAALFTDSARELKKVRTITLCGLFAALAFVIGSFSVQVTPSIKIGFSGLPNELVDFLFGPVVGCIFSGTMDILKLIVKPTGPWIPGLTLNTVLAGLIYGIFLYKKPIRLWRILAAKFLVAMLINVVLGTIWLAPVVGKAFWVMVPARLTKNLLMWPINSLVLYLVLKVLEKAGIFRMMKSVSPGVNQSMAKETR